LGSPKLIWILRLLKIPFHALAFLNALAILYTPHIALLFVTNLLSLIDPVFIFIFVLSLSHHSRSVTIAFYISRFPDSIPGGRRSTNRRRFPDFPCLLFLPSPPATENGLVLSRPRRWGNSPER